MDEKVNESEKELLERENQALKEELARRDAEKERQESLLQAKKALAEVYLDFPNCLAAVEELLAKNEAIAALSPMERYRIGYLMQKGEQAILTKDAPPDEAQIICELKKRPELLMRLLKGRNGADSIPGFSFSKSVGIRTAEEQPPQTLTEARNAAIRYAKMR